MIEALTPPELRVLGALVEKEATVPDTYPMTLNGLRSACNQKSSREPVSDYDERTIQETVDALKAAGLVRFVYASHGARSTKYRHVLDDRLALDRGELALLAVLFLRGPQTVNELRTRTERAHGFTDNEAVIDTLTAMAGRDQPLAVELERQPGQKETRWVHVVGAADPSVLAQGRAPVEKGETDGHRDLGVAARTVGGGDEGLEVRVAELEQRVAALESLLTEPAGWTGDGADDASSASTSEENSP